MTSPTLRFRSLQPASAELKFGADDLASIEYFDLALSANISAPAVTGLLVASYDNAVSRGPKLWDRASWDSADPQALDRSIRHQSGSVRQTDRALPIEAGIGCDVERRPEWNTLASLQDAIAIPLRDGSSSTISPIVSFVQLSARQRPALDLPFSEGVGRGAIASDAWMTLSTIGRPDKVLPWSPIELVSISSNHPFSVARKSHRSRVAVWQSGKHPVPGKSDHSTTPVTPPEKYDPDPALRFVDLQPASLILLFGKKSQTAATIVVPVRTRYMTINTQSVVLAETGEAIEARNISLGIDAESWTWTWSASVPASYEPLFDVPIGEIVELIITLNGTPVRVAAERPARDRSFGKTDFKISGKGRAAWLDKPYAKVVSRSNTEAMTAQQLMAAALTENGVSLGWDIDWQLTDWIIPAGVWSHTGTAIEACLAIAAAAGGYIQADPTEKTLHVLPRYPAAPWDWATLTPDIDLPEDVCIVEGIETVDKTVYNSVYLAGQANGVLCHVTRSGTDGGKPAPMVVDPLITHADAGRQAGLEILADTGRQKTITLSLPLLAETGMILPGKVLRYRESGNVRIGMTRGLQLSAQLPKTRQSITVETHVL